MAKFERKCKRCAAGITASPCGDCGGSGVVLKSIKIPVRVSPDNRPPKDFVMIVTPGGEIHFKQKGHKTPVTITVQHAFNRAQQLTAIATLEAKQGPQRMLRRMAKRGLLSVGGKK